MCFPSTQRRRNLPTLFKSLKENYGPYFLHETWKLQVRYGVKLLRLVNEMLVKKSADFAGRPQTYAFIPKA
ncbi:hypothetical protein OS493_019177 [Desmophyllum pertusum]|uniref:Uncharacterized protein n=1 Tax=Desmophyllum pertusum TaxID=174260 RepID=A0A9W9YBJ9_9CNID|nr:hypothetical protein OS493_019177 [Desmophyllum pertusum]